MFDKQMLIVQANKLIMAPQRFTLEEKRFLLCIISKIQPNDDCFKSYKIHFKDYAFLLGANYDNITKILPKITKNIMRQIIEIEDEEAIRQRAILISADHIKRKGYVEIKFHPDLKDVLLDLKNRFTQYKLENILHLRSAHAIRLYEIIKAHEFMSQKRFRLLWSYIPKALVNDYEGEDIQKLLGTTYKKFHDFEKWVLKPAQKELKEHTDLCFNYQKVKNSRYIIGIDITIVDNIPVNNYQYFDINAKEIKKDAIVNCNTVEEMKKEAFLTIEKLDRNMLCYAFQAKVKAEYGVDFNISILEEYMINTLNDVFQSIGSWQIQKRTPHSVNKYIKKVLEEKELLYQRMKLDLGL